MPDTTLPRDDPRLSTSGALTYEMLRSSMERLFNMGGQPSVMVLSRKNKWWLLHWSNAKTWWAKLKLQWLVRWGQEGFDVHELWGEHPITWRAFLPPVAMPQPVKTLRLEALRYYGMEVLLDETMRPGDVLLISAHTPLVDKYNFNAQWWTNVG
jgi:hypothetical protein